MGVNNSMIHKPVFYFKAQLISKGDVPPGPLRRDRVQPPLPLFGGHFGVQYAITPDIDQPMRVLALG